jgi:predicted XRE-type DNA-binding protein
MQQKVTGTKAAFLKLISRRGIYTTLGVERSTVANWKRYIAQGKTVSIDKMEEMLLKAGAEVVKEKIWKL